MRAYNSANHQALDFGSNQYAGKAIRACLGVGVQKAMSALKVFGRPGSGNGSAALTGGNGMCREGFRGAKLRPVVFYFSTPA